MSKNVAEKSLTWWASAAGVDPEVRLMARELLASRRIIYQSRAECERLKVKRDLSAAVALEQAAKVVADLLYMHALNGPLKMALEQIRSLIAASASEALKDAESYRKLRDVDPDAELPAVMIHEQDSWGNWRYRFLVGDELDAAIAKDAK